MNATNRRTSAILIVATCLSATDAQACGDLMLRTLGAMRFHPYATRHPAAILLYSGEGAKHPAEYDTKLHDSLEKVGHKVVLARGPDALAQALAARLFDVIIAYADDMDRVTSQIPKGSREPALIPVVDSGAANERQIRDRFPRSVSTFKELLRTIEQSMTPGT
jgi:hypothetical protein